MTNNKNFQCRICGKKFDSKTGRDNHERSHDEWDEVVKLTQLGGLSKEKALERAGVKICRKSGCSKPAKFVGDVISGGEQKPMYWCEKHKWGGNIRLIEEEE